MFLFYVSHVLSIATFTFEKKMKIQWKTINGFTRILIDN